MFANVNRDSNLPVIGGDGDGHYAFVETNERVFGPMGWALWYLDEPGGEPVQVDRSDMEGSTVPFFALDDGRLAWAAIHDAADEPVSQLMMAQAPEMSPTVLASASMFEQAFAFPDLDGNRLGYNSFENVGDIQEFRVYLMDLAEANPIAKRVDETGDTGCRCWPATYSHGNERKTMPYGWGTLEYGTLDGPMSQIDLAAMHTYPDVPFSYPSMGARFLAAHDPNHNSLYVFDLDTEDALLIEDLGEERTEGDRDAVIGRPHISGDLLAYIQGSDDPQTPLILKFARLPSSTRD